MEYRLVFKRDYLLILADKCSRLAAQTHDPELMDQLQRLAAEYQSAARDLVSAVDETNTSLQW